jgi:hypothetical protein
MCGRMGCTSTCGKRVIDHLPDGSQRMNPRRTCLLLVYPKPRISRSERCHRQKFHYLAS